MRFNPFIALYTVMCVIGAVALGLVAGPFFFIMPDITVPSLLGVIAYLVAFWLIMRLLPWWRTGSGAGSGVPVIWAGLWGALAVMPMVLPAETGISAVLHSAGLSFIDASITGAFPEELAKVTGVVVVAMMCRNRCDRPWHLMLLGFACGVGFELSENLSYGGTGALIDATSDVSGVQMMWIQRTLLGFALHPMLTALAGWGVGRALYCAQRSTGWRIRTALTWYFVAFLIHAGWNLNWDVAGVPLVALVVMPVLWIVLLVINGWIFKGNWQQMKQDRGRPGGRHVGTHYAPATYVLSDGPDIPPQALVEPFGIVGPQAGSPSPHDQQFLHPQDRRRWRRE